MPNADRRPVLDGRSEVCDDLRAGRPPCRIATLIKAAFVRPGWGQWLRRARRSAVLGAEAV